MGIHRVKKDPTIMITQIWIFFTFEYFFNSNSGLHLRVNTNASVLINWKFQIFEEHIIWYKTYEILERGFKYSGNWERLIIIKISNILMILPPWKFWDEERLSHPRSGHTPRLHVGQVWSLHSATVSGRGRWGSLQSWQCLPSWMVDLWRPRDENHHIATKP